MNTTLQIRENRRLTSIQLSKPTEIATKMLRLPTELRLLIYEYVTVDHDIYLADGSEEHGAFGLSRVCRIIRPEILPILPVLTDLTFHIHFTRMSFLKTWLDVMGPERILQVRKLVIMGPLIRHLTAEMGWIR